MVLNIDEVFDEIGEFGSYQKKLYILLCLPAIFVGTSILSFVFLAAEPNYRCFVPGCDNKTHPVFDEPFVNFTIPVDKGKYDSCHFYRHVNESRGCEPYVFSKVNALPCSYGIVFDRSIYSTSLVTEFYLTCSSTWKIGSVQAIYFAGILIGTLAFGVISDQFGRRKTILATVIGMLATGISTALVPNFDSFNAFRFFNAFFVSGVFQTCYILSLEFVGRRMRVLCGTVAQLFFVFGEVILGLLAMWIREWRMIQLVISVPVSLFLLYYWIIPESVRWLQAKGKYEKVLNLLYYVAKKNGSAFPQHLLDNQNEDEDKVCSPALVVDLSTNVTVLDVIRTPILCLRMVFMFYIWIVTTLVYYSLSYNSTDLGTEKSPNKPYIDFILTSLAEIPGLLIAWFGMSFLGRRFSTFITLILSGFACGIASLIIDVEYLLILSLLGKCCISATFTIIYVYVVEIFPTSIRNTILGCCSMFARIGGMLAPFSKFLKYYYVPLPMIIFGCLSFLAGLASLIMPETINSTLPNSVKEALSLGKSSSSRDLVNSDIGEDETQCLLNDVHPKDS